MGDRKTTKAASPWSEAAPEPDADLHPTVRVVGVVQEYPGYRLIVADIPRAVLEEYRTGGHPPDLKAIVHDKASMALWGNVHGLST